MKAFWAARLVACEISYLLFSQHRKLCGAYMCEKEFKHANICGFLSFPTPTNMPSTLPLMAFMSLYDIS
ncbi:hypothetical protein NC652_001795 [Populus alba x Populus x berolinensis]|uniref:Uncharacterized protein n=1 Tax=Populus alba x Populus x berolinensis TaxID=444605 RepID=A0AAD6WGI0_9ROSI|nr:hypothetical protein NC652_001795 [Populus alba x Populus x berolinensis]KAJ7011527.1 hypothetical protein NC653_001841 [Populus alba x Populus x berolinensis]